MLIVKVIKRTYCSNLCWCCFAFSWI